MARLIPFLLLLAAAACGGGVDLDSGTYDGQFECTEIDADRARLIWDADAETGQFGWIPSNASPQEYVLRPIPALDFNVTFENVDGVDGRGESETVVVAFQLTATDGKVEGPGTLTRADGTVETCSASF